MQVNHNCKAIQFNLIGFYFDPTFWPVGGPSSGNIWYRISSSKVYNCVTSMFTFVAMVTIVT